MNNFINLFKIFTLIGVELNPEWLGPTGYPDMLNSDNTESWTEWEVVRFALPNGGTGMGFLLGGKPQVIFERKPGVVVGCFNKATLSRYNLSGGLMSDEEVLYIKDLLSDSSIKGVSNAIRNRCMSELDTKYRSAYTAIKLSKATLEDVQLIVRPRSEAVLVLESDLAWGENHMPDPQRWTDNMQVALNKEADNLQECFLEMLQMED